MSKTKNALLIVIILLIVTASTKSFASNNYAYALSGGSDDMGGVTAASNVYSAYHAAGFDAYRVSDPGSASLGSILNRSPKILFSITHGNPNQILFSNCGMQTGSEISLYTGMTLYGVQRYSWNSSELVMLTSCESANGSNSIVAQIADKMNENTTSTIGWTTEIDMESAQQWSKYFHRKMAQGGSVRDARSYANSFTYNDSRIKTPAIYGNWLTTVIDSSSRSAQLNNVIYASDNDRKHTIEYDVFYYEKNDINTINNMLKNEFPNFNSENYKIEITNQENGFIIDYTLQIGNFSTLSGYTIFIENGKVTEIYDNTIVPASNTATANLTNMQVSATGNIENLKQTYKNLSSQKILNSIDNSTNTEQSTKLFYDIKTGKKYIIVTTTNLIGESKALISDYYEIN